MVFRIDTTCPECKKDNSVFGYDFFCKDCAVKHFMKRQIRQAEKERIYRKEIHGMKKEIREKLHNKLLKEVLAELDIKDKKEKES